MGSRVRRVSTHRRAPLDAEWTLCATPAGSITAPDKLPDAASPGWLPVERPDTVAGILRRAGRWSLDGPVRRFDAEDWWFRARFDAPPRVDGARRHLEFAGLAGECQLWLNGAPLLFSNNMHVTHSCIEPPLNDRGNELVMRFASLDAQLQARRPRPRWRAPMIEHQQLRWVRTSLLGRTPGWSLPAPVIGPWRGIAWTDCQAVELAGLRLDSVLEGDIGRITLRVDCAPIDAAATIERVTLKASRLGMSYGALAAEVEDAGIYAASLEIPDAARWWPHTHGEAALYDVELHVDIAGRAQPVVAELGGVGFRQLQVDTQGGDFALTVNGVPVFCRGANWTPLDAVSPAGSPDATRAALVQARNAGFNMLRVNGCMVYEDEDFFDACDELGLLVWQDFMFANMDYPANDADFTASVTEEARQQLLRWQAHPSLAIICGNSEAEQQAAMWGSPREQWAQPLFDEHLAALSGELCPGAAYWPSSAHGGAFPHQNDMGTTSYYGVGAYLRPLDDARRSNLRFASECLAFANVPPPSTIARMPGGSALRTHHPGWKARTPRDLGAGWDFEDVRDHYLQRLYGVDPVALRSTDHDRYLQLSRAVSAEVIEAAINEWRRPASTCRGALVWFLRDLWAGAGWGLLDEQGAPKAAFHGLRRACPPVHLFLTDEGTNGLALHLVNDPATPLAASIEVALYRDDGLCLQASTRAVELPPHGGQSWPIGEWFDGFVDISRAYRFGPSEYALVAATLRDAQECPLDRGYFFPEGQPASRERDIGLAIAEIERQGDDGLLVSITAQKPAQSVYFDAEGYCAEEEFFHLAPGEVRKVRLARPGGEAKRADRIGVSALNAWSTATGEVAG